MVNGEAWRIADGRAEQVALDDTPTATGGLVWVHLNGEDDAIGDWLRDVAGLPDYAVAPLTAAETRPRCDVLGEGAFVNLRGLSSEQTTASDPLASVRLYASKGRVHSVTRRTLTALDAVREEVAGGEVADPGDLIVAFAAAITQQLDPRIADLGDRLDGCEEALDADGLFDRRREVNGVRIEAIGYRRFLVPQRAALEKLAGLRGDWLGDDDRLHLAAAADRAARMAEEVDAVRERAALVHEALTDLRAEQIDQRSLQIAVVAMVFLPLTFITGLLGMNVKGIPWADEPWAFAAVVALCVGLSVAITAYFVRRHWLNR